MTPHLSRWALAALLAAAAWVAACGPSTGGTGTGASAVGLQAYGATPVDLCSGTVATAAGCVTANPGALRPVAYFASAAGDVVATIDANDVRLETPCRAIVFEGTWARTQTLGDRFYGALLVGTPVTDLPPASMAVQSLGDGSSIDITLRDSAETVLLGPLTLLRVAAPPAPACSG